MNIRWFKEQWDRALACIAAVVGVVALVFGWFGASGASLTVEQIPYVLSGAVVALFALGTAATLWLSADLRDEWSKLDEINDGLNRAIELQLRVENGNGSGDGAGDEADTTAKPARRRRLRAGSTSGAAG